MPRYEAGERNEVTGEKLYYDRLGNPVIPPHERIVLIERQVPKARSHKLFIIGLIVLVLVVLTHMGSGTDSQLTSSGGDFTAGVADTPTDVPDNTPFLPKYLGAPEANLTATWGQMNEYGGYGTCPTNSVYDAWKVGLDAATDRVNRIEPRDGCFPGAPPWEIWSRAFVPPDAQLVDQVQEDGGTTALHYVSDWLKLRIGVADITVRGDPATNFWAALTGWMPMTQN